MTYRALFIICILPTLVLGQTGPQPDKVSPALQFFSSGIICSPETIGEIEAPGTLAGATYVIAEEPPFISDSRRVPAVIGVGFGVKSQSYETDGLIGVTMTISHAEMGPTQATSQTFQTNISGEGTSLTFYQFEHDYELVLGIWQMEAMHDNKVVYRTTFEIVPPETVPELAGICGFENLLF